MNYFNESARPEGVITDVRPLSLLNPLRLARIAFVLLVGGLLISLGFAVDGTTEVGHHAFLIIGGMVVGACGWNELRRR